MTDTTQTPPAAPATPTSEPPAKLDPASLYPDQAGKTGTEAAAAAPAPGAAGPSPTSKSEEKAAEGEAAPKGEESTSFLGKKDDAAAPKGEVKSTPFDATALKVEEGFELAPETMTAFSKIATDRGLSTEAAQELLDLQTSWQKQSFEESKSLLAAQDREWAAELSKDPAYAGANGVAMKASIGAAVEQFGSPEVYQLLDAYGLGNNPTLVRFIGAMARAAGEGRPTPSGQPRPNGGTIPAASAPLPQRLYPAHFNPDGTPKQG